MTHNITGSEFSAAKKVITQSQPAILSVGSGQPPGDAAELQEMSKVQFNAIRAGIFTLKETSLLL